MDDQFDLENDIIIPYLNKEFPLSRGIQNFGLSNCIEIFTYFYNHYKLPCISIGSGMGLFENLCQEQQEDMNLILIDPNPFRGFMSYIQNSDNNQVKQMGTIEGFKKAFNKQSTAFPHLNPNYDYIESLIKERNDLINQSTMLLNWCDPGKSFTYDYDAIYLMKPVSIFAIYERIELNYPLIGNCCSGGAGTQKFHEFISYIEKGNNNIPYFLPQSNDINEIKLLANEYKIIHEMDCKSEDWLTKLNFKMIWLERKDRYSPFRPPEVNHLPKNFERQVIDSTLCIK